MHSNTSPDGAELEPAHDLPAVAAVLGGALLGAVALASWFPGVSASLLGPEPKFFWQFSRASAFSAFGLLWLSMALGLSMTNKLARIWPGGPTAFDLHQHASILGVAFALLHAVLLLGDRYVGYSAGQIFVPLAGAAYRPLEVGLGQIAFYLMAMLVLSFLIRRRIGHRLWRAIHFTSFLVFGLALAHGLLSGTDSPAPWAGGVYWAAGGTLLFLTFYRVFANGTRTEAGASPPDEQSTSRPSGTTTGGETGRRRRLT